MGGEDFSLMARLASLCGFLAAGEGTVISVLLLKALTQRKVERIAWDHAARQ